jgi:phosphopantothenoylcysteine decarboxylase / phosphopantothenate---cysteine ligase
MVDLSGRRVVVGVSGGIAAYKACELVSRLKARGADVWVVMTPHASEFVGGTTFRALSGRPVATEMFSENIEWEMQHLSLSDFAEVVIIAPATANVLGKIANGLADDLLTTAVMAADCPIIIAPAMNFRMWANPMTQRNVAKLREVGYVILEPEEGRLAEGTSGKGRLPAVEVLMGAIEESLTAQMASYPPAPLPRREGRNGDLTPNPSPPGGEGQTATALAGKRVVVTAGPTREPIDPVRYISNRSSGKQGYALAEGAVARGAQVVLISGPTALAAPAGAEVVPVTTAAQMAEAVRAQIGAMDVFIAAAAPADYTPESPAEQKIKKSAETLTVELRRTEDSLALVGENGAGCVKVGFAAETENLAAGAVAKLRAKRLDLIVANDVSRADTGFETDENEVMIFRADGSSRAVPKASKRAIAGAILDEIEALISA